MDKNIITTVQAGKPKQAGGETSQGQQKSQEQNQAPHCLLLDTTH